MTAISSPMKRSGHGQSLNDVVVDMPLVCSPEAYFIYPSRNHRIGMRVPGVSATGTCLYVVKRFWTEAVFIWCVRQFFYDAKE